MKTKIITAFAICGAFASSATAADIRFDGGGSDVPQNWTTAANWAGDAIPGTSDVARISFSGQNAVINSAVGDIFALQVGVDEGADLDVLAGGSLTAIGTSNFSGIGFGGGTHTARLNINGGSLTVNNSFTVGFSASATSFLNVNSGSMRVNNVFSNGSGAALTTITGGLLDVNSATLNSGVINIAGGTLRLRNGNQTAQVATWQTAGRITANNNAPLYSLVTTYDSVNNWTTVTSIPEPTTGLLCGLAGLALLGIRRRA